MNLHPLLILAASLAVTGCAAGDRGLVSPHQPIVSAAGAHVPDCPNWNPTPNANSLTSGETEGQSANYGCATALNLAAMIADPADLLRGRSDATNMADVATRAVKSLRDSPPSGKGGAVATVSAKGAN